MASESHPNGDDKCILGLYSYPRAKCRMQRGRRWNVGSDHSWAPVKRRWWVGRAALAAGDEVGRWNTDECCNVS